MNKKIVWGLGIIILAGIAWYMWGGAGQKVADTSPDNAPLSGKIVPNWKFESQGVDETIGAERTKVTLILGDTTYDAGTYNGSCAEIGATGGVDGKGLVAGEVSGVQCWFAGGGDEVGLFSKDGTLTLQHGELGEPQGDGTGAFRGNFKTLLTIGQ